MTDQTKSMFILTGYPAANAARVAVGPFDNTETADQARLTLIGRGWRAVHLAVIDDQLTIEMQALVEAQPLVIREKGPRIVARRLASYPAGARCRGRGLGRCDRRPDWEMTTTTLTGEAATEQICSWHIDALRNSGGTSAVPGD